MSKAATTGKTASSTIHRPSHYQTDGKGKFANMQAVDVIETFFLHDSHLSQAFKYMARAGKKPDSSYVKDVAKAVWWLLRALVFHGGKKEAAEAVKIVEGQ